MQKPIVHSASASLYQVFNQQPETERIVRHHQRTAKRYQIVWYFAVGAGVHSGDDRGDCLLNIASVEIIERPLLAPLDIFVARQSVTSGVSRIILMPFSLHRTSHRDIPANLIFARSLVIRRDRHATLCREIGLTHRAGSPRLRARRMHRASATGPSCRGGLCFCRLSRAVVSREQLRQDSARSNAISTPQRLECASRLNGERGQGANLGSPSLIVNTSKGKRLQPAANAGAVLLGYMS